jgi:hypothetical protein
LILAVLNSGLPAILDYFLDQVKPAIDIVQTFILTAPLSLSFTLISLGLLRGWFHSFRQFLGILSLLLLSSWMIGYALGWHPYFHFHDAYFRTTGQLKSGREQLISLPLVVLEAYVKLYGARFYFSSVAVGGFFGWAWAITLKTPLVSQKEDFPPFKAFLIFLSVMGLIGCINVFQPESPPARATVRVPDEGDYILQTLGFKKPSPSGLKTPGPP